MRGMLPVNPLNRVLEEFRDWKCPTLMLVGNHDQVRHVQRINHPAQAKYMLWSFLMMSEIARCPGQLACLATCKPWDANVI